ncbi:hypothetical protein KGQ34_01600 [Patescibacteria group bacterium]|nr:hypothetical protein [Patescibacteria group bacterium]
MEETRWGRWIFWDDKVKQMLKNLALAVCPSQLPRQKVNKNRQLAEEVKRIRGKQRFQRKH